VYRDRALSVLEPAGPLETKRLLLRPFVAEDFDAVFAMQSRLDVARYLYWDARNEDEVRTALEKKIAGTAIRSESDALSLAVVVKAAHSTGEIGFIVHPDHQGHGYATESVRVLTRLAFEDLQLHRVIGRAEARNIASARVLEKLGMRREAHLIENEYVKGEWQSELVYAMLDREWRAITERPDA